MRAPTRPYFLPSAISAVDSAASARDGGTTPADLRAEAPLLDAWCRYHEDRDSHLHPMFTPGHKQVLGRPGSVGPVVRDDVPHYGGLDTVAQDRRVLAEAEHRAAAHWGADWCRFAVGGSTQGNLAVALALAAPGDEVVVSRTLHRSLLTGLVLAGLVPVWVRPRIDAASGLPGGVPAEAVAAALRAHPAARAVLVGDPSYAGLVGDVPALARAAHEAGVPLVVDAAWGAHLGAGPDLPGHPLARGADVVVTSVHKSLPAYSQAALVLARTADGRVDRHRLDRGFDAVQTTSPAGSILASTDAARALMQLHGPALTGRLVAAVRTARERLARVPGLTCLDDDPETGRVVDPTKLVVLLAGTGAHGPSVEADLRDLGFPIEMADRDTLVAMVTVADEPEEIARFADLLALCVERHRGTPRRVRVAAAWDVEPVTALTPREAFFAGHETVPADLAVGRVSAELVAPYPPGVPVLAPGEIVTAQALAALRATRADGGRIAYAADPTLATLQVVTPAPGARPR